MTRRADILPRPEPFGLRRETAAAFVGLSAGAFDAAVERGELPAARLIGNVKIWSRRALEQAIDGNLRESCSIGHDQEMAQCDAVFIDSGG